MATDGSEVCHYYNDFGYCPDGSKYCGTVDATRYACNNNVCSVSATGTYSSMDSCNSACTATTTKYACANGACSVSATGTYDSQSACNAACTGGGGGGGCVDCFTDSTGPCQSIYTVCYELDVNTGNCPPGSTLCPTLNEEFLSN